MQARLDRSEPGFRPHLLNSDQIADQSHLGLDVDQSDQFIEVRQHLLEGSSRRLRRHGAPGGACLPADTGGRGTAGGHLVGGHTVGWHGVGAGTRAGGGRRIPVLANVVQQHHPESADRLEFGACRRLVERCDEVNEVHRPPVVGLCPCRPVPPIGSGEDVEERRGCRDRLIDHHPCIAKRVRRRPCQLGVAAQQPERSGQGPQFVVGVSPIGIDERTTQLVGLRDDVSLEGVGFDRRRLAVPSSGCRDQGSRHIADEVPGLGQKCVGGRHAMRLPKSD